MSGIMPFIYVAAGGAAGCVLRYGMDQWISRATFVFPVGTFVINLISCFLMGVFAAFAFTRGGWMSQEGRFLLMSGFCGGYSTLAALGLQTLHLIKIHHYGYAAINILGTPAVCLLVLWGGYWLGCSLAVGHHP